MKNLILILVLCLIPAGLLNGQTDIVVKKRLLSRIVVINGIRIKITRPWLRRKYRMDSSIPVKFPEELKPYLYKKSHEGFHKEIKPLYYDSIDSDRLGRLA
jgi:hypothetical protein